MGGRAAPFRAHPVRAAAILLVLVGATACAGGSAGPLVRRLEQAPIPDGAVLTAEERADGSFERGASASLDFSLPAPIAVTCPALLRGFLDAGYTVEEFSEPPQAPVTDPDAWCAAEVATEQGKPITAVIVIAHPPDAKSRYASDGISAALTAPRSGDPHPDGAHLRLSTG